MSECAHLSEDWQLFDLGEVAAIIDPHPSHRAPEEVTEGIAFAGIGDLTERGELIAGKGRIVSKEILHEHALRYQLTGNSIGFGRVATIGKVIDFRPDVGGLVISPTMAVINPHSIDRNFLVHSLRGECVGRVIDKWLTGSTRSSLGIELLRRLPIRAPSLVTQQTIGNVLSSVDHVIEKTETLIAKYQQIKAGLMHDLFTRGVTPDGKLRPPREQAPGLYRETAIGWIPREWETCTWGEVTESWAMGPRFSAEEYSENGNVATMRTTDIDERGVIALSSMPRAKLNLSGFLQHLLRPNDFLISRSGTCGIGAVFQGFYLPVLPGAFLIRFRFLPRMLPLFLMHYVNSAVGAPHVARIAEGGVQKNIRGTALCRLLLPTPSRFEQESIVARLACINELIDREADNLHKLHREKSGLMHDLLTGKVRVPLDTPALEPAHA